MMVLVSEFWLQWGVWGLIDPCGGAANIMPSKENKKRKISGIRVDRCRYFCYSRCSRGDKSEVSKQRRGEVMHYIVRVYYGQGPPSTLFIHSEHNKYGAGDLGDIVYSLSMDHSVKLITAINERGEVETMYEKDAS
jgi:hypothetical protein